MRLSEENQKNSNLNEKFQITSKNNSLVFSWKYPIQWYVISIPVGGITSNSPAGSSREYTIEELNEQLNQRITDISTINTPLKIQMISNGGIAGNPHTNKNTITVEITHPAVVIDIYQSSIRTALGFPEHPD